MDLADRLRGAGSSTVAELAVELGVSRRTLLRDLALLRERGIPISGEPGPGGGVRLEGERGVTAVHLSLGEIVTLWLAARLSQAGSELPWGSAASSGLAKLLASLPRARAAALRALCRRVVVGPPASTSVSASAGKPPSELLGLFEQAFSSGTALAFQYRDREGKGTQRRVEPHGLLVQSPVWYVLGRDIDKDAPRTFRMDRITQPRLLAGHHFRPDAAVIRAQLEPGIDWRPLL